MTCEERASLRIWSARRKPCTIVGPMSHAVLRLDHELLDQHRRKDARESLEFLDQCLDTLFRIRWYLVLKNEPASRYHVVIAVFMTWTIWCWLRQSRHARIKGSCFDYSFTLRKRIHDRLRSFTRGSVATGVYIS